jgi:hypothetical protein
MATSGGSFVTLFSLGFGFEAYCCSVGAASAHMYANIVSDGVNLPLYDLQVASVCACTMSELHQAVLKSDLDAVQLLLGQTTLDVNAKDLSGALAFAPLHLAARRGDVKVLRCLLLDSRVDIEARDATRCTALRHAMGTGQLAAASKYLHQQSQQSSGLMLLSWLLLLLIPVASDAATMPLPVACQILGTHRARVQSHIAWVTTCHPHPHICCTTTCCCPPIMLHCFLPAPAELLVAGADAKNGLLPFIMLDGYNHLIAFLQRSIAELEAQLQPYRTLHYRLALLLHVHGIAPPQQQQHEQQSTAAVGMLVQQGDQEMQQQQQQQQQLESPRLARLRGAQRDAVELEQAASTIRQLRAELARMRQPISASMCHAIVSLVKACMEGAGDAEVKL